MNDLARPVRRARRFQIAVVVLGMITGYLFPMAQRVPSGGATWPLLMLAMPVMWLATPLLYMALARAVEEAVVAAGGRAPERSARSLAALMFIPMIAFVVEIIVLFRLAKTTETVTDEVGKSQRVLWLAIARPVWTFVGFPLAYAGALVDDPSSPLALAMSSLAPLGSLVLLGFATQILMQPLLDRAAASPGLLGATGASTSATSAAFPSSRV